VLVIDDDPLAIQLVMDALDREIFNVSGSTDAQAGLQWVARHRPPLVLLDLVMPGVTGMELLEQILATDPGIDVILVTGDYSTDSAVQAIQRGAYDYWTKPLSIEHLHEKLAKWVRDTKARQQTLGLDRELLRTFQCEGIVGRSPLMLEVLSKIRRIAPHFQTAFVTGETGTGKELAARAIHFLSPAASGPFVVCNCAAIAENLFESELFGHVRGAFTGAYQDKQGLVEAASGGTLFLDEITEMPLATQAKLLRLLQNREIQPVGSPRPKRIEVRIVAATNRDTGSAVRDNKLRDDLYYRLSTIELKLPRLADRKEDLPLLMRHFLDRFAARYKKTGFNLTRRAQVALARYSWPGNIRELENALDHGCMMAGQEIIDLRDLPEQVWAKGLPGGLEDTAELVSMRTMQVRHSRRVLEQVAGNRERAARILEISRTTLYRLLLGEAKDQLRPSLQIVSMKSRGPVPSYEVGARGADNAGTGRS